MSATAHHTTTTTSTPTTPLSSSKNKRAHPASLDFPSSGIDPFGFLQQQSNQQKFVVQTPSPSPSSAASPSKRTRPSPLQSFKEIGGGCDPFPSMGTPTKNQTQANVLAPALVATLEKELELEEEEKEQQLQQKQKTPRQSFLAPLDIDGDETLGGGGGGGGGVDPFLPSMNKTVQLPEMPWGEGEVDEGEGMEDGHEDEGGEGEGFDDEEHHLKHLTKEMATLGK